jgi:hypothetical protein
LSPNKSDDGKIKTKRIPALFSSACRELWVAAQSGLESGVDHTGVVRWFEELARIRLKDEEDLK